MDSSPPQRSLTTQEFVAQELRNSIIRGEFRAGESVLQEALSEKWKVSRTSVREALRTLQAEGTLTYRPRRGYTVSTLALDEIDEIFEVRDLLETKMLRSVERVDESAIDAMTDASKKFARAADEHDLLAMSDTNRAFHFQLFACAQQSRTLAIVQSLWESTNPYRAAYWQDEQVVAHTLRIQQRSIDLARLGDGDALVEMYKNYRRATHSQLRDIIQDSANNKF